MGARPCCSTSASKPALPLAGGESMDNCSTTVRNCSPACWPWGVSRSVASCGRSSWLIWRSGRPQGRLPWSHMIDKITPAPAEAGCRPLEESGLQDKGAHHHQPQHHIAGSPSRQRVRRRVPGRSRTISTGRPALRPPGWAPA